MPGDEKTTGSRSLDAGRKVSVVIPCYNEEAVLQMLFDRLNTAAGSWPCDYEVVLVDDGSRDATWSIVSDFCERDPRWKGVRLARNFGHQAALWTGLQHVNGDVVAILDADLQDPPEILTEFFEQWEQGSDVIYGVRRHRKEGPFKRFAYFLYYRILSYLAEVEIPRDSGDFCVMDRCVVDSMLAVGDYNPFIRGIRAWVGYRQMALPYERDPRAAGDVKYTFRKLMGLAINGILSFSTRPLRLATYVGFIVSGFALLGALFTLIQRIFASQFAAIGLEPVPGFATIVIALLFVGGVQLIFIGILGEYVGRVYDNVKRRPQSVVAQRTGLTNPAPSEGRRRPS